MLNLKLRIQKVKEFNGGYNEWQCWKSRTECTFNGSEYVKILTSPDFAMNNPLLSRVVYSQLVVITVDASAYHIVRHFEDEKDGHEAWVVLCECFNGD